jgi:hypothetical protein
MAASKRRNRTDLLAGQTDPARGPVFLAWHRPGKRVKVWSRTLRRAA